MCRPAKTKIALTCKFEKTQGSEPATYPLKSVVRATRSKNPGNLTPKQSQNSR
ncbi:hypothetical protein HMPREF0574_0962 [Mobiluncus curtisii subsp. curtisii ATCC 35241]|nr:hypothetical protein HMPREF0574_0962 [Mobiluncus curtisii subsp. curtisii ATCC 35241]